MPKGTLIISSLYSVNMDPSHFEEPDAFRPQRFLDNQVSGLYASESIEWFIEAHAFLRPYDSAPRPPLPPSPVSKFSIFLSLPVEPNHMTAKSLILCKLYNNLWYVWRKYPRISRKIVIKYLSTSLLYKRRGEIRSPPSLPASFPADSSIHI